jgi:hypothetical protein
VNWTNQKPNLLKGIRRSIIKMREFPDLLAVMFHSVLNKHPITAPATQASRRSCLTITALQLNVTLVPVFTILPGKLSGMVHSM